MVVSMSGKRVKVQRPYTTEQVATLFKDNCFYLYDVKVVDEGTLVDLFGPIVIEILDMLRNSDRYTKYDAKSEYPYCGLYGGSRFVEHQFRAVNMAGFAEVASVINERIVAENYAYTGGAIVDRVFAEREEAEQRRREEVKAKRAAARAAKKAAEG